MARMSQSDWQLVREAMSRAIDERKSFYEAYLPQHGRQPNEETKAILDACESFIERADAFCLKHFGSKSASTQWEEKIAKMESVSIFALPTTGAD